MSSSSSLSYPERIWYEDPKGFVRPDRLASFLPEANTSLASKLNAIFRFLIYLAILVALFRWTLAPVPLALVVGGAFVTGGVYFAEMERLKVEALSLRGDVCDEGARGTLPVEVDPRSGARCVSPTRENPYMNVMLTDYGRMPERPAACDMRRQDVTRRVKDLADGNLYVNSDDIYGTMAGSQREFVTQPITTIPNDQEGFARWLYDRHGSRRTCREGNGDACAYLDLGVGAPPS